MWRQHCVFNAQHTSPTLPGPRARGDAPCANSSINFMCFSTAFAARIGFCSGGDPAAHVEEGKSARPSCVVALAHDFHACDPSAAFCLIGCAAGQNVVCPAPDSAV